MATNLLRWTWPELIRGLKEKGMNSLFHSMGTAFYHSIVLIILSFFVMVSSPPSFQTVEGELRNYICMYMCACGYIYMCVSRY